MASDAASFRWLIDHPSELMRRYGGQWVAVHNDRIIASGADGLEVYQEARRLEPAAEIVMERVQREAIDFLYEPTTN